MASSRAVSGYRLVAPRWAASALSGEGARLYGGRWNSPGRPVVYLGSSRALTVLELLVHLTTPSSREKPYALLEVSVPGDSLNSLPLDVLPKDWRVSPPAQEVQAFGDEWLASGNSLGLWVPSAIIPGELNLLLNPEHPKMKAVVLGESTDFSFDPRLVTNPSRG